eukprot:c38055_g1_i1 orf=127-435(+)
MAGYEGNLGSVRDLGKLCEEGRMDKAVHAVEVMERRGIPISVNIVLCLLQGCSGKKDLATIMRVQSLMVRTGLDSVALLDDHLIRLFASYGRLLEANQVFCK